MRALFEANLRRAEDFWLEQSGLRPGHAKNRITRQTMTLPLQLAQ